MRPPTAGVAVAEAVLEAVPARILLDPPTVEVEAALAQIELGQAQLPTVMLVREQARLPPTAGMVEGAPVGLPGAVPHAADEGVALPRAKVLLLQQKDPLMAYPPTAGLVIPCPLMAGLAMAGLAMAGLAMTGNLHLPNLPNLHPPTAGF